MPKYLTRGSNNCYSHKPRSQIIIYIQETSKVLYMVCSKSIANFEFPRVTYIRFSFFMALCWYSYPLLVATSSVILNVQLIFDSYFAWTCFGSSSVFAYSRKWIKWFLSNFVRKTKLSSWTHFECWLWHTVKLPWTKSTFICGTKCSQKAEKMWTKHIDRLMPFDYYQ